ncbi:hypothetical protein TRFO_14635 [Tritrichomonas foetus]|uniref:Uncharacterized protein n=1 Tax=Tritrichomonas foetus TaxID=1144522 RepID=A0A1J4KUM4_9EUKA|nr:hypothetical protein TRFO_14635 [Tritrichomonas foetus]|eukprot:OHT14971.1 hypothetical protein TRFO_14635 [Tritrichomonas foetus]
MDKKVMNEEETENTLQLLRSLRWPSHKLGYLMSSESDLPPYRVLAKMLRERKINQQMTWNKAQCIEALGGIENVNDYMTKNNIISENVRAAIENELQIQKEITDVIQQKVQGSADLIRQIVQNEETSHIDQQMQMFS